MHDPSDPASQYRADVRYRALFHHEILAGRYRRRSAYAFVFPPPHSADDEEMRKTAYDQVHAFPLRRLNPSFSDISLPERVWVLRCRGQRNADIARKLRISRQAVSRALKRLDELQDIRQNEAWLFPHTHEVASMSGIDTKPLREVWKLRRQGRPVAEIAHRLHYFKYTIRAAYRRLDAAKDRQPA